MQLFQNTKDLTHSILLKGKALSLAEAPVRVKLSL